MQCDFSKYTFHSSMTRTIQGIVEIIIMYILSGSMAFHPILLAAAASSARAYYSRIRHCKITVIPASGVTEAATEEDLLAKLSAIVSRLGRPST